MRRFSGSPSAPWSRGKVSALVVISLDSIDGTRESPRYVQPNRANPSQNARRSSVRWMASKIEISRTAKRQGEDAAVPELTGLSQGGKADPKDQDEHERLPRWKRKPLHGMVPGSLKDDLLKTILFRV